MPLLVRLKNNAERYVTNYEFEDLLAEERIVAFKRASGGWVDPKIGPMRGSGTIRTYEGPERRSRW